MDSDRIVSLLSQMRGRQKRLKRVLQETLCQSNPSEKDSPIPVKHRPPSPPSELLNVHARRDYFRRYRPKKKRTIHKKREYTPHPIEREKIRRRNPFHALSTSSCLQSTSRTYSSRELRHHPHTHLPKSKRKRLHLLLHPFG